MNTANNMTTEIDNQEPQSVPTLVVGLGKTGLSCAVFLARRGVPVAVTDSRANPPGLNALRTESGMGAIALGGFDKNLFAWAQRVLVSPGVSVHEPLIAEAQARGAEVLGDVELFARVVKAPVLAITGSNGKSTVTTLLGEMIEDAGKHVLVGGNIGPPVLDLLSETPPDFYVLELSSFQLETTRSLNAAVAVVLNISADHMDRYKNVAAYAAAKRGVYGGDGVQVINRDDPVVSAMVEPGRKFVSFGLDAPNEGCFGRIHRDGECWLACGDEPLMAVQELRIVGEHNQANALAALAMGAALGLPMATMLDTLRRFSGLPHRTQWVAKIHDVNWYNDSKGTNIGATRSALQGLVGPLVLIAGGQGKGADFTELRNAIKGKVRALVLIGEDAQLIANAVSNVVPVVFADDMNAAVQEAHTLAQEGDSVLLSPACASFDMFAGFEARGEAFMSAVHGLGKGGTS